MRALGSSSGIFKGLWEAALRARRVSNRPLKSSNPSDDDEDLSDDGEQQEVAYVSAAASTPPPSATFSKEAEHLRLRNQAIAEKSAQYSQQFKKVDAQVKQSASPLSTKQTIQEQRRVFEEPMQSESTKRGGGSNRFTSSDSISGKFYSEQELTAIIRKQKNPEHLFRLYNAHKFTYSAKNLVHTLTQYAKLVREFKQTKLKSSDRRIQTLLYTIQSHPEYLSPKEKSLALWSICKLNITDDVSEKLISELIKVKGIIEFKDLAILFWVIGKSGQKNLSQINELCMEVTQRLDDPNLIVVSSSSTDTKSNQNSQTIEDGMSTPGIESDTKNATKKSADESEFEELEQLLDMGETNTANVIPAQSLSMVLWSLGKLAVADEDLLKAAVEVIKRHSKDFSILMLSNILYSFSNIRFKGGDQGLGMLCGALKSQKAKFNAEPVLTLKTLLVALCRLKVKGEDELLIEIVTTILKKSAKKPLSARFVSEIAFALAKRNVFDAKVYETLAKNSLQVTKEMNLQDCTEMLYALAKYVRVEQQLLPAANLVCLRLVELAGKMDRKSKDFVRQSLSIGKIQNKPLQNIIDA